MLHQRTRPGHRELSIKAIGGAEGVVPSLTNPVRPHKQVPGYLLIMSSCLVLILSNKTHDDDDDDDVVGLRIHFYRSLRYVYVVVLLELDHSSRGTIDRGARKDGVSHQGPLPCGAGDQGVFTRGQVTGRHLTGAHDLPSDGIPTLLAEDN